MVNGIDLSQHWKLNEHNGQWWMPIGFLSDLGVHVYEVPNFGSLMVCTETECVPLRLEGQNAKVRREGEQWLVRWDTFANLLNCQWEQRNDEIVANLPPTPLPHPLKLGEKVPDIFLWRGDGITMRLYDWAGKPFVLFLEQIQREKLHERIFSVKFILDFQDLPEGSYADPFGLAFQIFGDVNAIGISGDLIWLVIFDDLKGAEQWLENQDRTEPIFVPSLTIVLSAWLETIKQPESPQAWLTFADVQRLYCSADASVPSYERAIQLGCQNDSEAESWARWRLGALKWLQGDKKGAKEVWSQGKLPQIALELNGKHLR